MPTETLKSRKCIASTLVTKLFYCQTT